MHTVSGSRLLSKRLSAFVPSPPPVFVLRCVRPLRNGVSGPHALLLCLWQVVIVFFERIQPGLPGPSKDAVTAAELDSPAVLLEYPRSSVEELRGILQEEGGHSSDAFGRCFVDDGNIYIRASKVPREAVEWAGGDPRTGHSGPVLLDGSLAVSCSRVVDVSPWKEGLATPPASSSVVPVSGLNLQLDYILMNCLVLVLFSRSSQLQKLLMD